MIGDSRRPGRPRGSQASAREKILDLAAAQIAARRSVQLVVRELARDAGVTPALLHYYFGDVSGLLDCLIRERAEPLLLPLRQDLHASTVGPATRLSRFLQRWSSLVARQPWLLPCLLQPAGTASAEGSVAADLREVVRQAQQAGRVRTDLPDHYVAMLLLSLGALPQLCGTQLGHGLDLPTDPAAAAQLTLLHLSLLQRGITASAS